MKGSPRLMVALVIVAISLISYFSKSEKNEFTGKTQQLALTEQQEIALGLQSAPQLVQEYGGESRDSQARSIVDTVGARLIAQQKLARTPYKFQFHLLADTKTINAFALPGGHVFITEALLRRLKTEGALAGVLGHEIGHVVGRHGAAQLAKQGALQGIAGAATVAVSDPNDPKSSAKVAAIQAATQLVNLKYGRNDELEADKLGVEILGGAGYDPRAMISVMQTLQAAGSGARTPQFFSSHPNPENRIPKIEQAIRETYPSGVPSGLTP